MNRFSELLASHIILFVLLLISFGSVSHASTLLTPGYTITVQGCEQGVVVCHNVRYTGVSRKSGRSIALVGKTIHTTGADGVTPSRFIGYQFRNGTTEYFVSVNGRLLVTRGSEVLVDEKGDWKW